MDLKEYEAEKNKTEVEWKTANARFQASMEEWNRKIGKARTEVNEASDKIKGWEEHVQALEESGTSYDEGRVSKKKAQLAERLKVVEQKIVDLVGQAEAGLKDYADEVRVTKEAFDKANRAYEAAKFMEED